MSRMPVVAAVIGLTFVTISGCSGQAAADVEATATPSKVTPTPTVTVTAPPSPTITAAAVKTLDYLTMEPAVYTLASGLAVRAARETSGAGADPYTDEQIINAGKATCEALRSYSSFTEVLARAALELPRVDDLTTVTNIAASSASLLCPGLTDRLRK